MGLSGNQARFLSLTARQVDLEHRIQRICQQRLNLSSQMQRESLIYNEKTSDRRLFLNTLDTISSSGELGSYDMISSEGLFDNGFSVYDKTTNAIVSPRNYPPDTVNVSTAEGLLEALAGNKNVRMTGDIDLTSIGFTTIDKFSGQLFADGNTLKTNRTLFNEVSEDARVYDLIVNTPAAGVSLASNSGLIANTNKGIIDNVLVGGDINAGTATNVGAVVGTNYGKLSNALSSATITNGTSTIGGICGTNTANGELETTLFTGSITSTGSTIGGICGLNSGDLDKSTFTGSVNITGSSSNNVGGIVGNNSGTLETFVSGGVINGYNKVGGVAGINSASGIMSEGYSVSTMTQTTGGTAIGSLAGANNGTIGANTYYVYRETGVTSSIGSANTGSINESRSFSSFTSLQSQALNDDFVSTTVTNSAAPGSNLTSGSPAKVVTIPTVDGVPVSASGTISKQNISLVQLTDEMLPELSEDELRTNIPAMKLVKVINSAKYGSYANLNIDQNDPNHDLSIAWEPVDDGYGNSTLVPVIKIFTANGLKALNENSFNSGDATTKVNALAGNYILVNDIDLTGFAWKSIGDATNAFTGTFNGNNPPADKNVPSSAIQVSNLGISVTGDGQYVGFFGNVGATGIVDRLSIDHATVSVTGNGGPVAGFTVSEGGVGAVVGYSTGKTLNCNATNINITMPTGNNVGGVVGGTGGDAQVSVCSSSGSIALSTAGDQFRENYGIGGLVGYLVGGDIEYSSSSVNVSVTNNVTSDSGALDSNQVYVSALVGDCDTAAINRINSCYASGTVNSNTDSRLYGRVSNGVNNDVIVNSYYKAASGSDTNYYAYDSTPSMVPDTSSATKPSFLSDATVWNSDGSLNVDRINTRSINVAQLAPVQAGDATLLKTVPPIDLETGLRNGRYSLAVEADAMTQNKTSVGKRDYELVDWRTTSIVNDDEYEGNDEEAQTEYDDVIKEINSKDKDLELEQTNVESEYKAITTEKDALKKVLETNTQSSFKYFS